MTGKKRDTEQFNDEAKRMYSDALVWDDNLSWQVGGYGDADHILQFKRAGVDVIAISVAFRDIEGIEKTFRAIASVFAEVRKYPDTIRVCRSVIEILNAREEDKAAVFMTFQETIPFEENLDLIELYYIIGVRQALLAYNIRNSVGDGCAEASNAGLSNFGRKVIAEMNRVGMIVDGAHSGHRTTMEAIELCDAPFIFSHTNVHALFPHYRNVRNDQIKACAQTDGVIGITGSGEYMGMVNPTSESVFTHIDYIAQLVGAQHVGIGLDYVRRPAHFFETGVFPFPHRWPLPPSGKREISNFLGPEAVVEIVELMLAHGYSESDIRGVLGENFLRVARKVWK